MSDHPSPSSKFASPTATSSSPNQRVNSIPHLEFRGGGSVSNASGSDEEEQEQDEATGGNNTSSTTDDRSELDRTRTVDANAAADTTHPIDNAAVAPEPLSVSEMSLPSSSSSGEESVVATSAELEQEEENRAIDAYIDHLLASVESNEGATTTALSLPKSLATAVGDALNTSDDLDTNDGTSLSSLLPQDLENANPNDTSVEEASIPESGSSNSSAVEVDDMDATETTSVGSSEVMNVAQLEDDDDEEEPVASDDHTPPVANPGTIERIGTLEEEAKSSEVESTDPSSASSLLEDTSSSTLVSTDDSTPSLRPNVLRRRPPPPNKLYRFLLRHKSWGGHVTAMMMVWMSEWTQLYVPFAAYIVQYYVWNKLLGGTDTARSQKYVDEYEYAAVQRQRASGSSSGWASTTTTLLKQQRRSGTSKKALKKLTKQADQVALQVLQRLTKQSKYKYISTSFMQRHRLGPFGQSPQSMASVISDEEVESTLAVLEADVTAVDTDAEEEEDADWVIQALTVGGGHDDEDDEQIVAVAKSHGTGRSDVDEAMRKTKRKKSPSKRRPNLNLASILQDTERTRPVSKMQQQRISDRDAGVWGKLRAATSDSLGRSLLGAYPGDAVPISEAGNPNGLYELAKRYGYGEWSDDSDNEEDQNGLLDDQPQRKGNTQPAKRRKKLRHQQHQEQQPPQQPKKSQAKRIKRKKRRNSSALSGNFLGVEFDVSLGSSASTDRTRTKRRKATPTWSPTTSNKEKSTSASPSAKLSHDSLDGTTTPRSSSKRTSHRRSEAQPIRPAMERTEETQRPITLPLSSERKRGAVVRPTMGRLSSLEKRRGSVLDNDDND